MSRKQIIFIDNLHPAFLFLSVRLSLYVVEFRRNRVTCDAMRSLWMYSRRDSTLVLGTDRLDKMSLRIRRRRR